MSEPVISIRNLTRDFGKKHALDDVSLQIPRGTVFGLVGENGSGKTTLIRHLLGLLRPQTGAVSVFGLDPVTDPVGVLGRIGYLSEDRELPDWMRIEQLMRYTQAFFPNWDDAYAEELRGRFRLNAGQKIRALSRGERARTGLLVALAHRPELLVLDEPSSGLDPVARRDILASIVRTAADEGRTVLFSSHLLDEVERVADRVAMIENGKIVLSDELDTILAEHRRMTLRFDAPQQYPPQLPGALTCTGEGREWIVVCNGRRDELLHSAESLGGNLVDESNASLDEIFVSRINRC